MTQLLFATGTWIQIPDGDPVAAEIYMAHYSSIRSRHRRIARDTKLILGPGYKMLLTTPCRRALFGWRKQKHRDGVECAIFSNRGAGLSSDLIRAADELADRRWPGERHYTYVDARMTGDLRSSRALPGQCFIHAGWRPAGLTERRKLNILERAT